MKRIVIGVVAATLVGLGAMGCPPPAEGEGEGEGDAGEGEGDAGEGEGDAGEGEGDAGEGEGEPNTDLDPNNATVIVVKSVIDDFIGRAIANNVYNGWFSNGSLNAGLLKNCLVHQVSTVLALPNAHYSGAADVDGLNDLYGTGAAFTCRSMTNAHAGLKIPSYAYDALVGDVLKSVNAIVTDPTTNTAVTGALTTAFDANFKATIVDATQDAAGTASLYNKYGTAVTGDLDNDVDTAPTSIGGRNVLLTFLAGDDFLGGDADFGGADECGGQKCFLARVLADDTINGYFGGPTGATTNVPRLAACLQRQIAAGMGGPDAYADANGLTAIDSALSAGGVVANCVDMAAAHADLVEADDTDTVTGITRAELDALIGHAGATLTALGVDAGDIGVLAGFLNGTTGGMPGATNATVGQICRDITTAADADATCPAAP